MNNTNRDDKNESMINQVSEETHNKNASMPGNTTSERLEHNNALARILVSGLSVLCFNPNDSGGEIGFIDEHHDPLMMCIYKNAGCDDLFWSSKRDFKHSMDKVGITINTSKPTACRKYENGAGDQESFCHMPDLAKLHEVRKFEIKNTASDALSARVDVRDAAFYTYKMSENKAFLREKKEPSHPGRIRDYQRIGRILGADIFSEEAIRIQIKYKQDGEIKTYDIDPLAPGAKYTIVLSTKTHHGGAGHIGLIYKYIIEKPPGHPEFDYEFYPEEMQRDYCAVDEKATQFACESTGGGDGPLPVFPPNQ